LFAVAAAHVVFLAGIGEEFEADVAKCNSNSESANPPMRDETEEVLQEEERGG